MIAPGANRLATRNKCRRRPIRRPQPEYRGRNMILLSNPNGIANLPDIRDGAPMPLTAAAGELGCTNLTGTRAAKEFT